MFYKIFSSAKTLIVLLCSFLLVFFIGSLFPHPDAISPVEVISPKELNEWYLGRGGELISLVRLLNLYYIFDSYLLVILTILLLINIIVCVNNRLKTLWKQTSCSLSFEEIKNHQNTIIVDNDKAEKHLQADGFTLKKKSDDNPSVKIYEKGAPVIWFSLVCHTGIVLSVFIFFATSLFVKSKAVYVYKDTPTVFNLSDHDTRWQTLLKKTGLYHAFRKEDIKYIIQLNDVRKVGYQVPRMKGLEIIDTLKVKLSTIQKSWQVKLDIKKDNGEIVEMALQPNNPASFDDMRIYLVHPTKMFEFKVNNRLVRVKSGKYFKEGGSGFVVESGTPDILLRESNDVDGERLPTVVTMNYIPDKIPFRSEKVGALQVGENIFYAGNHIEFTGFVDGCLLYFKSEQTRWFLWLFCVTSIISLFAVTFGCWYRIQLACDSNKTYLLVSAKGIWSDKEKLSIKIQNNK
jgi:hypothetical protein